MTQEEFEQEMKALVAKYDIVWCDDSDYYPATRGTLFYGKDEKGEYEKFICKITNMRRDKESGLILLKEELERIYK